MQGLKGRARRGAVPLFALVGLMLTPAVASAAPGDLEPSFGSRGIVVDRSQTTGLAVAVLPSGRILTAGLRFDRAEGRYEPKLFIDARLPSGGLDHTFGFGGRDEVVLPVRIKPFTYSDARFSALDDGRVAFTMPLRPKSNENPFEVVVGPAGVESSRSVPERSLIDSQGRAVYIADDAVQRDLPDGSTDTGFGAGGSAQLAPEPRNYKRLLAIAPDDSVFVASSTSGEVRKLTPAGWPDLGFGDGGTSRPADEGDLQGATLESALVDDELRLTIAYGRPGPFLDYQSSSLRLTPSGERDPTYAGGGFAGGGGLTFVSSPAGYTGIDSYAGVYDGFRLLARDRDGGARLGFGDRSTTVVTYGLGRIDARALTVEPGGDILATGTAASSTRRLGSLALVRVTDDAGPADNDADGALDDVDLCPYIAPPGTGGCPQVRPNIRFRATSGSSIEGRIKARTRACARRGTDLKLIHIGPGKVTTTTVEMKKGHREKHTFNARDLRRGRYVVTSPRHQGGPLATCLSARSEVVEVG